MKLDQYIKAMSSSKQLKPPNILQLPISNLSCNSRLLNNDENQTNNLPQESYSFEANSHKEIMYKKSEEIDEDQHEKKALQIMPCAEVIKPGPSSVKKIDSNDKGRSRKKFSSQQSCPACGITLHSSNVLKHFSQEREKLQKWHMNLKKKKMCMKISMKTETHSSEFKNLKKTAEEVVQRRRNRTIAQCELLKPWMNFKCPNCHLPLMEPNDFLHHIEICASIQEDSVDVSPNESNSGLEEAVRFAHASSGSVIHLTHAEEAENVDVEIQIEEEFGNQQYFAHDLISINTEDAERLAAEIGDEKTKDLLFTDEKNEKDIIINSLRMKIHELEKKKHHEPLCAVCMGSYEVPLVSVICWHVHCEKCWLTTLKASSLCPLCKVITNVHHLRRVYI